MISGSGTLVGPGLLRAAFAALLGGAGVSATGLGFTGAGGVEDPEVVIGPDDLMDGEHERFRGETHYRLTETDGRRAVHARCDESASALWIEKPVDLAETPVVEWEWRVDEAYPDSIDETTRAADDYPGRLYVVDESVLFWRTRAINYVWSSGQPAGADWANAYRDEVRMVSVRSGPPPEAGGWKRERRNIREDFRRFHDRDVEAIDGVGIMTDCDDLETEAEAWYGTIRFLPETPD